MKIGIDFGDCNLTTGGYGKNKQTNKHTNKQTNKTQHKQLFGFQDKLKK